MMDRETMKEMMRRLSEKRFTQLGEQESPDVIPPDLPREEMPTDVPVGEPIEMGSETDESKLEEIRRKILGKTGVANFDEGIDEDVDEKVARRQALQQLLERLR